MNRRWLVVVSLSPRCYRNLFIINTLLFYNPTYTLSFTNLAIRNIYNVFDFPTTTTTTTSRGSNGRRYFGLSPRRAFREEEKEQRRRRRQRRNLSLQVSSTSHHDVIPRVKDPILTTTKQRRGLTQLHAKYSYDDDDDDDYYSDGGRKANRMKGRRKLTKKKTTIRSYDDDDDDDDYNPSSSTTTTTKNPPISSSSSYPTRLTQSHTSLLTLSQTLLLRHSSSPTTHLTTELSTAPLPPPTTIPPLSSAIRTLSLHLIERSTPARLLLLALLSGEHVLLLGPPGTGKSELARRVSLLTTGGDSSYFQRLLTKFTTPEELFGPLSLTALENDEYVRCTRGYLPTAHVAFLDEIFKANGAILNSLLTLLNERRFDNGNANGDTCPLRCVVAASNELPESEELDALYDRFLIRLEVRPVSDEGLGEMLSRKGPFAAPCEEDGGCDVDHLDDIIATLHATAENDVVLPPSMITILRDLRTFCREELDSFSSDDYDGVVSSSSSELSDRRLVKIARLLKLSAACHGRKQVDILDMTLLRHVSWYRPEQRAVIDEWLWENLVRGGDVRRFRLLLENLRREVVGVLRRTGGDVSGGARGEEGGVVASLREQVLLLIRVLREADDDLARQVELLRRCRCTGDGNGSDEDEPGNQFLWLSSDEILAMKQMLLPKAEKVQEGTRNVLRDAIALELALRGDDDDGMGDNNDGDDKFTLDDDVRLDVIEMLCNEGSMEGGGGGDVVFTDDELEMGMKQAKAKFDADTFRMWKRARKKLKL